MKAMAHQTCKHCCYQIHICSHLLNYKRLRTTILSSERRCHLYNVFSHWLVLCSAIDGKQAIVPLISALYQTTISRREITVGNLKPIWHCANCLQSKVFVYLIKTRHEMAHWRCDSRHEVCDIYIFIYTTQWLLHFDNFHLFGGSHKTSVIQKDSSITTAWFQWKSIVLGIGVTSIKKRLLYNSLKFIIEIHTYMRRYVDIETNKRSFNAPRCLGYNQSANPVILLLRRICTSDEIIWVNYLTHHLVMRISCKSVVNDISEINLCSRRMKTVGV